MTGLTTAPRTLMSGRATPGRSRSRGCAAVLTGLLATTALAVTPAAFAAPTPPPVGTPPVAVVTVPDTVWGGVPVTLSGADSTGGPFSEWEWDLDDDGRFEQQSTGTPTATATFRAGRRTVGLRVRNSSGLVSTSLETFTVRRAPAVTAAPIAPTGVAARARGTSITVTWDSPVGVPPLAHEVTVSRGGNDGTPVYVPSDAEPTAVFADLVPGTYVITVAGVNGGGTGAGASAEAIVYPRGVASGAPTGPAEPDKVDPATSVNPSETGSPSAQAIDDGGTDRGTIGIGLVALGIAVLVVAGGYAAVTRFRR